MQMVSRCTKLAGVGTVAQDLAKRTVGRRIVAAQGFANRCLTASTGGRTRLAGWLWPCRHLRYRRQASVR